MTDSILTWKDVARRLRRRGLTITEIAKHLGRCRESIRCAVDPDAAERKRARDRDRSPTRKNNPPAWVPEKDRKLWKEVLATEGERRGVSLMRAHCAPRVKICGTPPEAGT